MYHKYLFVHNQNIVNNLFLKQTTFEKKVTAAGEQALKAGNQHATKQKQVTAASTNCKTFQDAYNLFESTWDLIESIDTKETYYDDEPIQQIVNFLDRSPSAVSETFSKKFDEISIAIDETQYNAFDNTDFDSYPLDPGNIIVAKNMTYDTKENLENLCQVARTYLTDVKMYEKNIVECFDRKEKNMTTLVADINKDLKRLAASMSNPEAKANKNEKSTTEKEDCVDRIKKNIETANIHLEVASKCVKTHETKRLEAQNMAILRIHKIKPKQLNGIV